MDERTEGQLRVIREVIAVTQSADIPVWLLGDWGNGRGDRRTSAISRYSGTGRRVTAREMKSRAMTGVPPGTPAPTAQRPDNPHTTPPGHYAPLPYPGRPE